MPVPDPPLPPSVFDALRDRTRAPAFPSDLDRRLRAELRGRAPLGGRRQARRGRIRGWTAAAAVGMAVALAGLGPGRAGPAEAVVFGDFDRNGRVDILDVRRLAAGVQGDRSGAAGDVNGDGRTDASDVAALAARVVAVGERG